MGDLHKDGYTQTKLPVDAYYAIHQLVVEYKETDPYVQVESVVQSDFDDDDDETEDTDRVERKVKKVISREEKRHIYDLRRAEILPKHDIDLVVISYSDFKYDAEHKIIRDEASDLKIISKALKENISTEES